MKFNIVLDVIYVIFLLLINSVQSQISDTSTTESPSVNSQQWDPPDANFDFGFPDSNSTLPGSTLPNFSIMPGINSVVDACSSIECQNGGTCDPSSITCMCLPGFAGPNCESVLDACSQNPCVHAIDCISQDSEYVCECEPGWTGLNCDAQINECDSFPCQNNAVCVDGVNTFSCLCSEGFTGQQCETNIDDCASIPCLNGGICIDGNNNYTCQCLEMYSGSHCEILYDACESNPCQNNGTCSTTPGQASFTCECMEGFDGIDCNNNIDDCFGVSCPEGQICFDFVNNYECQCPVGFTGFYCDEEINECEAEPCLNGGTCNDLLGEYVCSCPPGYTGVNCDEDIDECEDSPCLNGICVNKVGTYECYCRPGFSGSNCSIDFDECLYRPCQHGGTCLNKVNSYECQCAPGYTGVNCEIDIDECATDPCQNNATCIDGIASFTCNCLPGFTDNVCSTNIDECEPGPCENDGQCIDGINIYTCNCSDTGFKGEHCEINIDDCESNPCMHGAECNDLIKDYKCNCFDGYEGKQCEIDINECASSPCQNDGMCLEYSNLTLYEFQIFSNFSYETAGGFLCECQLGFTGDLCEINIDECEGDPCENGNCIDGINEYNCECFKGYEGVHCETEINECERYTPCVFGSCEDLIGDYNCICDPLYGGKNCSVELLGCVDVECYNGGECIPFYKNEYHDFVCECKAGFTGKNCEKSTTFSLDGEGYVVLNSTPVNGYDLKINLRTTLPNVVLALGQGEEHYYTLVLQNSRLKLHSTFLNRYNGVFAGSDLNDGEWKFIRMFVNQTHAHLVAPNDTQILEVSDQPEGASFMSTFLGGVAQNLKILVNEPAFTGCMQDISLGQNLLIPSELSPESKVNTVDQCLREPQCEPNPCGANGDCIDLWSSFSCLCNRPFWGDTCNNSFGSATFGNENSVNSLAVINIPLSDQASYREKSEVSMLVRTTDKTGTIFYLGSNLEDFPLDHTMSTYIMAELQDGNIIITVQLADPEERFIIDTVRVDDGEPHLLLVVRDNTALMVAVDDEKVLDVTLSTNDYLSAEVLYLGGLPLVERVKRQLGEIDTQRETRKSSSYKGVIQDVRLRSGNETRLVELFPLFSAEEESDQLPGSFIQITETLNVLNGTVSDDTCTPNPCLQGGICTVTFNDFKCTCPSGYKGKRCDELEFCGLYECPNGSTCRNLVDGYECLIETTFNGNDTNFIYNSQIRNLTIENFSAKFRTKVGGILISIVATEGGMSIGIAENKIIVNQWNNSIMTSEFNSTLVTDGNWHLLNVSFKTDSIMVYVDETPVLLNSSNLIITNLHDIVQQGYIEVGQNSAASSFIPEENRKAFRGCMAEPRLEDVILPFYSPAEIANNSAFNKFIRQEVHALDLGCRVCFQSECHNGGFCSDPASMYECSCHPGFEGSLCEINIDECLNHSCANGAVCIDGINDYTCHCSPGFTGRFCEEDIDECASDPCKNNGTCHNEIAMFHCHCTSDYTGETCGELKIKNCSNNRCQHGSTCKDIFNASSNIANDYMCICPFSYEGKNCEYEVDFCRRENIDCIHGSCNHTHVGQGWECVCEAGFEGTFCEKEIDECLSQPCQNDATCKDKFLGYECICKKGWRGKQCEDNINECVEQPHICQNGGNCTDTEGYYFCDCVESHCGAHCSLADPCYMTALNCSEHGQCTSMCNEEYNETDAICACFEGWEGKHCGVKKSVFTTDFTIIISVFVAIIGICVITGIIFFVVLAKKKRETSGTYSPSKQEFYSPRVEMGNMMKPPPEERLI